MADLKEEFDRSDLTEKSIPRVFSLPASRPGAFTGALFAVLTLFPSMPPKGGTTQGVVLGITFAAGYAVGGQVFRYRTIL